MNTEPTAEQFAAAAAHAATKVLPPAPLPMIIDTELVPTDTEPIIKLQISTPQGVNVYFIDQQTARAMGVDLQAKGSQRALAVVGR